MTVYSFIAPFKYTADATLYQRNISFLEQSPLNFSLSALSSGASAQTPIDQFQLVMTSRPVADLMIKQGLDKVIFKSQWDPQAQTWTAPPGLFGWLSRQYHALFGFPAWSVPDDDKLSQYLLKNITAVLAEDQGTLELSYDNPDPKIARMVLTALIADTKAVIRNDQVAGLKQVYQTISQNLGSSGNVDLVNSASQLASQSLLEMTKALAQSAQIGDLDPIRVDPQPSSPKPLLNVLIGLFAGLLIIGIWHFSNLAFWIIRDKLHNT